MNDTQVEISKSTSCCGPSCCQSETPSQRDIALFEAGEDPEAGTVRRQVREFYAGRARTSASCCGDGGTDDLARYTAALGYSDEEQKAAPEGANLGLGCGNPTAIDTFPSGATVLDLGSGGGFDCFIAAHKVGPKGHVIGVDMTPEMIDRARSNVRKVGLRNVEFRLGEIENLPVADSTVDVVISNCVINLSPEKERVFAEAYRVLKPGGRLMVSDLVLTRELPETIRRSAAAYAACIAGAEMKDRYLALIDDAGFTGIRVAGETTFAGVLFDEGSLDWLPEELRPFAADFVGGPPPVVSIQVIAEKPVE